MIISIIKTIDPLFYLFCCFIFWTFYLYLSLSNQPPGSPSLLVIEWCSSNPGAYARGELVSVCKVMFSDLNMSIVPSTLLSPLPPTRLRPPPALKVAPPTTLLNSLQKNAQTCPFHPCPICHALPFFLRPSGSARHWGCPPSSATVNLHWPPASDWLHQCLVDQPWICTTGWPGAWGLAPLDLCCW